MARVIAKDSGDKLHPANAGRLCTKGATHVDLMRAVAGAWRRRTSAPNAAGTSPPFPSTTPSPRRPSGSARSSTSTDPTRSRCTSRGRCRSRRSTSRTSSSRATSAGLHIESNSRLCMAIGGHRLQAVARRRRPARVVRGHRPRRPVLRHRLQHGRLPPDPVPADGRPPQAGREAHRRRPAPHRDRRTRRPVSCRSRRAPTSRCSTACCTCSSRTARIDERVRRRAHRGLGRRCRSSSPSTPRRGSPRSPASPRPTSAPPRA